MIADVRWVRKTHGYPEVTSTLEGPFKNCEDDITLHDVFVAAFISYFYLFTIAGYVQCMFYDIGNIVNVIKWG